MIMTQWYLASHEVPSESMKVLALSKNGEAKICDYESNNGIFWTQGTMFNVTKLVYLWSKIPTVGAVEENLGKDI